MTVELRESTHATPGRWSPLELGAAATQAPYRSFRVTLPAGPHYFTVLDREGRRVETVDAFLFSLVAQGGASSTTQSYASGLGLFLTWSQRSCTSIDDAPSYLGRFVTWLRHWNEQEPTVVSGPGSPPVRSASRINTVLAAVREFYKELVGARMLPPATLDALYKISDDHHLPAEVRGEQSGLRLRVRPRHHVPSVMAVMKRATDDEVVGLLDASVNSRDRLIVCLGARGGLRRGEIAGLRLEDIHLLPGRRAGCDTEGPHLHVVRRTDNPNGAVAKSRRPREVPCDPLLVRVFDDWMFDRDQIPDAERCDFVIVTLTGPRRGHCVRPGLINDVLDELSARTTGQRHVHPHMLRHAMLSNVVDFGGTLDEAQALAGHASVSTAAIYQHRDPERLRRAVERVPSPRGDRPALS